ncbi:unnamed protein product [Tetraodon nigroviridis]|uniref:(spotted green pufferfish) hypothetical protein n=1 Tax=Tetraodon nigroviridis TaxID=99883 RepID=Q4ST74_TETNG|nr:unnamed protein product [Tetraodon nigroviridis]
MYSYVPEHLVGYIIGKNGNGVKKIIKASGVIKIILNVQGMENIPQRSTRSTRISVLRHKSRHPNLQKAD